MGPLMNNEHCYLELDNDAFFVMKYLSFVNRINFVMGGGTDKTAFCKTFTSNDKRKFSLTFFAPEKLSTVTD